MNLQKLLDIDRRIIFLAISITIAVPLFFRVTMPMGVQKPTQDLFDTIDNIDRDRQCLMISTDFIPNTEAENQPMTIALLRHAFAKRIPVLLITLYIEASGLVDQALMQVLDEFNEKATTHEDSIIYGRDVIFLGWQPPPIVPILSMGESITNIYPTDFYGNPVDSLPLIKKIRALHPDRDPTYDDIAIVVALTSGGSPLWFVQFAQTKYGVKVGAGCTAVMAPDFYPYIQTGQLSGMMGGMKGAAEYEELVEKHFGKIGRRRATEGMLSQSAAHLAIMLFVVLGNIAYFAGKRSKAR